MTGNGATPFSQPPVVLTKPASLALTWPANDWRAHPERLCKRAAALQAEVAALQATVRDLTQRLYGADGWAHVRRDFLTAARSWPVFERWMGVGVDELGARSRRHAARLDVWDPMVPLHPHPAAFVERHLDLQSHLSQRQERDEAHR